MTANHNTIFYHLYLYLTLHEKRERHSKNQDTVKKANSIQNDSNKKFLRCLHGRNYNDEERNKRDTQELKKRRKNKELY